MRMPPAPRFAIDFGNAPGITTSRFRSALAEQARIAAKAPVRLDRRTAPPRANFVSRCERVSPLLAGWRSGAPLRAYCRWPGEGRTLTALIAPPSTSPAASAPPSRRDQEQQLHRKLGKHIAMLARPAPQRSEEFGTFRSRSMIGHGQSRRSHSVGGTCGGTPLCPGQRPIRRPRGLVEESQVDWLVVWNDGASG